MFGWCTGPTTGTIKRFFKLFKILSWRRNNSEALIGLSTEKGKKINGRNSEVGRLTVNFFYLATTFEMKSKVFCNIKYLGCNFWKEKKFLASFFPRDRFICLDLILAELKTKIIFNFVIRNSFRDIRNEFYIDSSSNPYKI